MLAHRVFVWSVLPDTVEEYPKWLFYFTLPPAMDRSTTILHSHMDFLDAFLFQVKFTNSDNSYLDFIIWCDLINILVWNDSINA